MQIKIPDKCPCCSFVLEKVNSQLFCRNTECGAQIQKKLEHFCKTLGIKGLGPKSIKKLELNGVEEIFYLDLETLSDVLSSLKVAEKLIVEIEKSKAASLDVVLEAFSIPLIGKTASSKICSVVDHVDEITEETCKQAGLGSMATNNLLYWLANEYKELKEFLPFSFNSNKKPKQQEGPVVCITGKLKSFKTKAEATKELEELGFRVTDSVTKTTNYLIDESETKSAKHIQAEKYGIPIVNNLIKFLKEKFNVRNPKEKLV